MRRSGQRGFRGNTTPRHASLEHQQPPNSVQRRSQFGAAPPSGAPPTRNERPASRSKHLQGAKTSGTKAWKSNIKYLCPCCHLEFDNKYERSGARFPLVLNCTHTVCWSCVQSQTNNLTVTCPTCGFSKSLKQVGARLMDTYPPNYHILGLLLWEQQLQVDAKQFNMVTTNLTLKAQSLTEISDDICCWFNCHKPAELRCNDCNDIYCSSCCNNMHKSVRNLWNHKQVLLIDTLYGDLDLSKCSAHPRMVEDMYCETCRKTVCSHCFCCEHEGHTKRCLTLLTKEESKELEVLKQETQGVYERLVHTDKKLKQMLLHSEAGTDVSQINSHFADLHGKLWSIERKLLEEVTYFRSPAANLQKLHSQLKSSIFLTRKLLSSSDNKLQTNLPVLLAKMRTVDKIPCHLVTEEKSNNFKLKVDPVLSCLDQYFKVEEVGGADCRLVTFEDLPSNYSQEDVQSNLSLDTISVFSRDGSSDSEVKPRPYKVVKQPKRPEQEQVIVTNIKSLDCFYVQLVSNSHKIGALKRQISSCIEGNQTETPEVPEINKLYLVRCTSGWRRGRVLEEIDDAHFEVFFIDYGITALANLADIREIPLVLRSVKPFVVECQLYNPTGFKWSPTAHAYLEKLIKSKDVRMVIHEQSRTTQIVDLQISSSNNSFTSVKDLLINTCQSFLTNGKEAAVGEAEPGNALFQSYTAKIFDNSRSWKLNQSEQVLLANVVHPHRLFVIAESNMDALLKLQSQLKRHFKSTLAGFFMPALNSFVGVKIYDKVRGIFHRALIKGVDAKNELVDVYLVDWGVECKEVRFADLRMLSEKFTKMEAQAIEVRLADIEPMGATWAAQATQALTKHFVVIDSLRMLVVGVDERRFDVVLFDEKSCLNGQLVEAGWGRAVGPWGRVCESSHTNPVDLEENSLWSERLKFLERQVEDCGVAEAALRKAVRIIRFDGPSCIFVKFHRHEEQEESLMKELRACYSDKEARTPLGEALKLDCKCVVYIANEDVYLRGCVTKLGRPITVYLIDKGVEIEAEPDNLFVYHDYFFKYPNVIVQCHLAEIKPAGGSEKWSKSAEDLFRFILSKYKEIFIRKVCNVIGRSMPVEMWYQKITEGNALTQSQIDYISINSLLILEGLAFKCKIVNLAPPTPSPPEITTWLPPPKIIKTTFNAYITCAERNGVIHLHEEHLDAAYKELEAEMKIRFKATPPTQGWNAWRTNEMCTILQDDKWYRGLILNSSNHDQIEVLMIDFGSTHFLNPKVLFKEILFPMIEPFASPVMLNNFPEECDYQFVLESIPGHANIVVRGSTPDGSPLVDVYDSKTKECFNKLLIKCESTNESDDPVIVEEVEQYTFAPPPKGPTEMTLSSVSDFSRAVLSTARKTEEYNDTLFEITSEMQEVAPLLPPLQEEDFKVGQPCVALFRLDKCWYRAKIIKLIGYKPNEVSILYVDFGNVESIHRSKLKKMKSDWFALEVQTYEVVLNIRLTNRKHRLKVKDFFKKLENSDVVVQVVSTTPLTVDLYDFEDRTRLAYQSLIDYKLIHV